ncbi:DNA polymerase IV [Pseudonocardia xishanensis]|uniref:DNA polymerase IV n=1 Tax=Pseudonocardia xishanensis TaxID=630995 RepID=A0ABP8RM87_9PSEU
MTRWVLHVDLDQFLAAVEQLRRPELRGRPVVVGGNGDPSSRTVVATASYEAREFGIHSGMPMRLAARRCPDAVFLPADNPTYEAASEEVMAVLREFDVVVEVIGWDEAFLQWDGTDPEALADEVRAAVRARTHLSCAVGIGDNTLRAKMATGFAKPGGVHRITAHNWFATFGDSPTGVLHGIGTKTERKLAELGIHTVTQLAEASPTAVGERLGPRMGPYYVSLGRGMGRTEMEGAAYVPRSRSRETTYDQDIDDWTRVLAEISALSVRVSADVADEGRDVARVGVKVRYAPFLTTTRSRTLDSPTRDPAVLEAAALEVAGWFRRDRPIRLLGVKAEFAEVSVGGGTLPTISERGTRSEETP